MIANLGSQSFGPVGIRTWPAIGISQCLEPAPKAGFQDLLRAGQLLVLGIVIKSGQLAMAMGM